MNFPPSSPPPIAALAPGTLRPTWSVMIPVFNGGSYLPEALSSVLVQAPERERMDIVVVDDASTDVDVAALVRDVGGERVDYFRQPHNIGSVRNFNTCLNLARGRYVHLLHADDRVLPGFYAALEKLFALYPHAGACFSRYRYMNDKG